jgi:hypothetical protein
VEGDAHEGGEHRGGRGVDVPVVVALRVLVVLVDHAALMHHHHGPESFAGRVQGQLLVDPLRQRGGVDAWR